MCIWNKCRCKTCSIYKFFKFIRMGIIKKIIKLTVARVSEFLEVVKVEQFVKSVK